MLRVVDQGRLHSVGRHSLQPLLLEMLQPVVEGRHFICEFVDRLVKVGNSIFSLGVFGLVSQSVSPSLQGLAQDYDDDKGGDSAEGEDVQEKVLRHVWLLLHVTSTMNFVFVLNIG